MDIHPWRYLSAYNLTLMWIHHWSPNFSPSTLNLSPPYHPNQVSVHIILPSNISNQGPSFVNFTFLTSIDSITFSPLLSIVPALIKVFIISQLVCLNPFCCCLPSLVLSFLYHIACRLNFSNMK